MWACVLNSLSEGGVAHVELVYCRILLEGFMLRFRHPIGLVPQILVWADYMVMGGHPGVTCDIKLRL